MTRFRSDRRTAASQAKLFPGFDDLNRGSKLAAIRFLDGEFQIVDLLGG
jgi:hypothetical protein